MTIHKRIAAIQINGSLSENGIISLRNDKHLVWAMILFEDRYYVSISILGNYENRCYYEELQDFEAEAQARVFVLNLPNYFNGEVYE